MCMTDSLLASYAEFYLRLMRTLDDRMKQNGASLARTKVLLFLQKRGAARATDLAEFFNQTPRTITEAIDGLERDGLVRRKPDPKDRRAKQISITPAGLDAVTKTEPVRRGIVDQTFGSLSDGEREQLATILGKLRGSLISDQEMTQ